MIRRIPAPYTFPTEKKTGRSLESESDSETGIVSWSGTIRIFFETIRISGGFPIKNRLGFLEMFSSQPKGNEKRRICYEPLDEECSSPILFLIISQPTVKIMRRKKIRISGIIIKTIHIRVSISVESDCPL